MAMAAGIACPPPSPPPAPPPPPFQYNTYCSEVKASFSGGGFFTPSACYNNDCPTYGVPKAFDGTFTTFAHTETTANPSLTLSASVSSDISSVKWWARDNW